MDLADALAGHDEVPRAGLDRLDPHPQRRAHHPRRWRLAPAALRPKGPGHEVQVQRALASQGQQELSVSRSGSRQRLLDLCERRSGVDGVRGRHALGASERIFPGRRLGRAPGLLRRAPAFHPRVARGAFLRDPPPDPLAAPLPERPQAAPYQRQSRPMVRAFHASRRTRALFLGRRPALDCSLEPAPRHLPPSAPRLFPGPGPQWLRQSRVEGRAHDQHRPLHPLPASQLFRGRLRRRPAPLEKLFVQDVASERP